MWPASAPIRRKNSRIPFSDCTHAIEEYTGLHFSVDSDDRDRVVEARDELHRMLNECKMGALGNGNFHFWLRFSSNSNRYRHFRKPNSSSSSSSKSINSNQGSNWGLSKFPLKQSLIASGLSLTGDTIAQLRGRYLKRQGIDGESKDNTPALWSDHDWLRSLRMASYGFLFYGPGSYAWYKLLDNYMPNPTVVNLSTKVLLNQIILGPCVIAVIFAWNNLWLGKLADLPSKYQKDAIPTLLYGFRFWIPVSILNFGVVPLSSRVAFMSVASIFWNFYLSTTMSK